MSPLPDRQLPQLSLGPLETEILNIVWDLNCCAVKDVHERILADPDRELAYASVTTILNRLTQKGWLRCNKQERIYYWQPIISRQEAQSLFAYEQLHRFLAVGNADIVAAFADRLDQTSIDQLEAIAQRLQTIRQQREKQ